MTQTRPHWLLVFCLGAVLASSCYEDLEDEDEYRERLRNAVNDLPRTPNMPPPGAGDGTGADDATTTDDSTTADDSTMDDSTMDDSAADDSTMDDTVTDDSGGGMFVPPPGCEDVPTAIFGVELKCGGIGCHGTPDVAPLAASDLGNMTDDLVTRLPASNGTGVCADYPLVDVDDPDNSLLITKLSESPPCGSPMPAGGTISDEERNCIIEWTRAVAAAAQ